MVTALEQEIGHGNAGLTPWSGFVDVTETVPELAWPTSITTYSQMRTDAQIASLLLGFTLPIRRYRWYISPNGARDEVVEDIANDFNLPIERHDARPVTRRRDRFSHDRHLLHALLMLTWGSMYFCPSSLTDPSNTMRSGDADATDATTPDAPNADAPPCV
jgi:hypothetical protein